MAKLNDNLMRHYLIQIAFEELGGKSQDEIHCELFKEALSEIGIGESEIESAVCEAQKRLCHDFCYALVRTNTNAEILGLNLGVEVIAAENIETLFSLLAYSGEAASVLNKSPYFQMHRTIEEGHLSLSISNFLKFCHTDKERVLFIKSFDNAMTFWRTFWEGVNRLCFNGALS